MSLVKQEVGQAGQNGKLEVKAKGEMSGPSAASKAVMCWMVSFEYAGKSYYHGIQWYET